MIRLESILFRFSVFRVQGFQVRCVADERPEVLENSQARRSGFLRVELDAPHAAALHGGGEPRSVRRRGDAVAGDRCGVGMREVDLRAVGHAVEKRRRARDLERVPADVRHLHDRLETSAPALERAESGEGGFLAALEQPLQAEADAEKRHAAGHCRLYLAPPRLVEERRRPEVADTRHDDAACACELGRSSGREELGPDRRKSLAHGSEIPRPIVNQRDHRSPFVLGITFASRRSREHAMRSARPKALKSASTL